MRTVLRCVRKIYCLQCWSDDGLALVVNDVGFISEVNQHRAQLVLGWVIVYGRVKHLGM